MNSQSTPAPAVPPVLHIIDAEYDVIADLAMGIKASRPDLAMHLLNELERAEVHSAETLPAGVVRLGATVEFIDDGSGSRRTVQLVLPAQVQGDASRLSILTPAGAGLIGLSQGDEMPWPDRDGRNRLLRIVQVIPPAA